MKKVITLIMFLVIFLCGCGAEPANQNKDGEENKKDTPLQLNFDDSTFTIRIDGEEELAYSTNYNGELEWISENENILTVEDGIITPVSVGTTKVIVRAKDSNVALSASITVTVKDKGPAIFNVYIEGKEYHLAAGKPVSALLTSLYGITYERRDGYAFDGWYIDRDFTVKFDINKTLTADITLYPKYRESSDYIGSPMDIDTVLNYSKGLVTDLGNVFTISPAYKQNLTNYDFTGYTVLSIKYDIENENYQVDNILTGYYNVPYDGFLLGIKKTWEKHDTYLAKLTIGTHINLETYSVNTSKKIYFNRSMDSGNVYEVLSADVTCSYSYAYDMTYGKAVYNKNGDKKAYPASTTKVITAMAALRYCSLDTTYTIKDDVALTYTGSSPSVAGLKVGQVWTLRQLLYAMLLPSGNDAAYAVACCTIDAMEPGNTYTAREKSDKFADLMNEIAEDCGAINSHFMVPDGNSYYTSSGAWDDRLTYHYTTASDMVKIAKYAFAYGEIAEVTSTVSKSLTIESGEKFSFTNTNSLLKSGSNHYDGTVGLKTGTTNPAGGCLISAVEYDGRFIILAVMKSNDRYKDSRTIYDLIFEK